MVVVVSDQGVPERTAVANLQVIVLPFNSYDPVFQGTPYVFTVAENSLGLVGTVSATDQDDGSNGEVRHFPARLPPF